MPKGEKQMKQKTKLIVNKVKLLIVKTLNLQDLADDTIESKIAQLKIELTRLLKENEALKEKALKLQKLEVQDSLQSRRDVINSIKFVDTSGNGLIWVQVRDVANIESIASNIRNVLSNLKKSLPLVVTSGDVVSISQLNDKELKAMGLKKAE